MKKNKMRRKENEEKKKRVRGKEEEEKIMKEKEREEWMEGVEMERGVWRKLDIEYLSEGNMKKVYLG